VPFKHREYTVGVILRLPVGAFAGPIVDFLGSLAAGSFTFVPPSYFSRNVGFVRLNFVCLAFARTVLVV